MFGVACAGSNEANTDVAGPDIAIVADADVAEAADLPDLEDLVEPPDTITPEDSQTDDDSVSHDAAGPLDAVGDVTVTDQGFTCECGEGEVFRWGNCVPTLMLGCGPSCDATTPCDADLECDDCAASSACGARDCRAACVVSVAPHALVPAPLRVSPVAVPSAGGSVTISGTSFYIGALGHLVRIGDDTLGFGGGGGCEMTVAIPEGLADGAHVLEVSQYSMEGPWVIAGIIYKGSAAPECVQPGMPCGTANTCCSAGVAQMACETGRCLPVEAAR